eukprot:COSAG02_NODE_38740_length_425_cov_1.254601_1_plen_65_part_10
MRIFLDGVESHSQRTLQPVLRMNPLLPLLLPADFVPFHRCISCPARTWYMVWRDYVPVDPTMHVL